MSPSPERFEEIIGRPLEEGDILVKCERGLGSYGATGYEDHYEILDPNATHRRRKHAFSRKWVESPGIKTRRRYPHGPGFFTTTFRADENRWTDIILKKEETDLPEE